jgi:hypothetical protein
MLVVVVNLGYGIALIAEGAIPSHDYGIDSHVLSTKRDCCLFDSSRLFSFTMPLASLFIQTIVISLIGVGTSGFYLLWRDFAARNIRRQVRCSNCLCFFFFFRLLIQSIPKATS